MKYDFVEKFPIDLFEAKEDYYSIYQFLEKIKKMKIDVKKTLESKKLKNEKTMEEIFAIFLVKNSEILQVDYYQEISFFISLYWKFILQKMREDNDSDDESLIETFMKLTEDPMDMCFLSAIEAFKKTKKSFLGNPLQDSNIFSIFLQHLRNWLFLCNFTDTKVNLLE